jgi:gluconolactonase
MVGSRSTDRSATPATESQPRGVDPLAHLPGPSRARVLVEGLDHPEGVAFDRAAGVLWAGGEAGQLYRVDVDAGTAEEVARAPGFVLGLAVDGRGRVAICVSSDGSLCAWDGRSVERVVEQVEGQPLVQPNYPAFGPDGTLYLSDSGTWGRDDGRLVAIEPDGAGRVLSRSVECFTNGCAVSPDGRWLWVVESHDPRVHRLDLTAASPRPELITRIEGTVLDGLAFTDAGGLLISCYRPDRIYHLDAAGELEVVAQDPQGTLLSAPTNVCFVGPQLDRVVSANLGRWHLTLLDLGLRGAPLHAPDRWAVDARE